MYPDAIEGRYCIIAHTGEGSFVFGRYGSPQSRDSAFSVANADLSDDIDMISAGAPYTLNYADDVIKFTKWDDE